MTHARHLHAWATSQLSAQTPFADATAWWVIEHFAKKTVATLMVENPELDRDVCEDVKKAVFEYCSENKPLGYILGWVPFNDLTITVKPPLLIPRSETEEWVEWLIESLKQYKHEKLRILDLCTGTGCIGLALAAAFPQAEVTGVDINPTAIEVAQKNAAANTIQNATFVESDLFAAVAGKSFDLVVSNPPYIDYDEWMTLAPSVKNWEDPAALVAPHNGLLFYEKIAASSKKFLSKISVLDNVPRLVVEIGYQQAESVSDVFAKEGYKKIAAHSDVNGNPRWISLTLSSSCS